MQKRHGMDDVVQFDSPSAAFRDALWANVEREVSRRMRVWERVLLIVVTVISLVGVVVCGVLLTYSLTGAQYFYVSGALLFAGVAGFWCLSRFRQGSVHTLRDERRVTIVVWGFLTVILVVEIITDQAARAIISTIAAMVVIGFPMTWDRIRASELRIQETILRLAARREEGGRSKGNNEMKG